MAQKEQEAEKAAAEAEQKEPEQMGLKQEEINGFTTKLTKELEGFFHIFLNFHVFWKVL